VTDELNKILIAGKSIYETGRFSGVVFSEDTRALLDARKSEADGPRLNRLLLLDAYPKELSNRGHSSIKETYLEIRYQPNALFVKTAKSLAGLDEPFVAPIGRRGAADGADLTDSLVAGCYGRNLWSIVGGKLVTDTLSPELHAAYARSNNNPVILQLPMFLPAKIMNLGLPSEKVGFLRWSGGRTEGTNRFGFAWSAELKVDGQGRTSGASVSLPAYLVRPGVTQALDIAITYEYGHRGLPIPDKIHFGTNWTAEIFSLELSDKPQAQSAFGYEPFLNRFSHLLLISERRDEKELSRAPYRDLRHSVRQVAGLWLTKRQLREGGFLLFGILTASIVAAGIAIERKRQKTKPTIQTEIQ
jgi:hypothetical protein